MHASSNHLIIAIWFVFEFAKNLKGMSAVKMRIQPCDENALPVAHTCFNLLDLPNITDREEMRRRLLICLEHSHGFNLV